MIFFIKWCLRWIPALTLQKNKTGTSFKTSHKNNVFQLNRSDVASKAHVYSFTDQTLHGIRPEAGTPCMCKRRPRVSMCVRGLPHVAAIHHPTRSCNPSITMQLLFITIIKQRLLWLQKKCAPWFVVTWASCGSWWRGLCIWLTVTHTRSKLQTCTNKALHSSPTKIMSPEIPGIGSNMSWVWCESGKVP